jgi:hypothetical protein
MGEVCLSYKSDRPQLVFAEVDLVAMCGNMDQRHIIYFNVASNEIHFPNDFHEKLMQFRIEQLERSGNPIN